MVEFCVVVYLNLVRAWYRWDFVVVLRLVDMLRSGFGL